MSTTRGCGFSPGGQTSSDGELIRRENQRPRALSSGVFQHNPRTADIAECGNRQAVLRPIAHRCRCCCPHPDGRRGSLFMKERYRENSSSRAEPPTRASFARVRQPRYWCRPQPRAFPGATVSAEDEDLSPSHSVDQGGRARAQGALESADASSRDRQEDETYREGAAAKGGDSRHWSQP